MPRPRPDASLSAGQRPRRRPMATPPPITPAPSRIAQLRGSSGRPGAAVTVPPLSRAWSAATAGVQLAAGSGSWSTLSDRNLKANFAAVDSRDVLQRLVALPVSTWNYRAQGPSIRHLGPTAQDFKAAFGLGEDDRTISVVDEQGVALAAIQGLYQENRALAARVAALEGAQGDAAALAVPSPPELPMSWAVLLGLGFGGVGLGYCLRRR